MKPTPGFTIGPEDYMFDEDSRELLEGMEGASVQEKLVDTDFFNRFEVIENLLVLIIQPMPAPREIDSSTGHQHAPQRPAVCTVNSCFYAASPVSLGPTVEVQISIIGAVCGIQASLAAAGPGVGFLQCCSCCVFLYARQ